MNDTARQAADAAAGAATIETVAKIIQPYSGLASKGPWNDYTWHMGAARAVLVWAATQDRATLALAASIARQQGGGE